jgi:hypothetical protein
MALPLYPQYPLYRWLGGPQSWSGCFDKEKQPTRSETVENIWKNRSMFTVN